MRGTVCPRGRGIKDGNRGGARALPSPCARGQSARIQHVPVPWSGIVWPSPFAIVLILGFFYLLLFRRIPRERQHKVQRKRQLEALLKDLD